MIQVTQLLAILATVLLNLTFGHVIEHTNNVVKTVTGRMYLLEPHTGNQQRLNRRHVDIDSPETPRNVRLQLESEGIDLDMTLTRRSVWTEESQAFERRGDEMVEVPVALDSSCFMSGDMTSGEGSASFSHCGGLSGFIQTPEMEYVVEQLTEQPDDAEFPEVAVTMVTPSNDVPAALSDAEEELRKQEEEERDYFKYFNKTSEEHQRRKRCADEPTTNTNTNTKTNTNTNTNSNTNSNNGADITAEVAVYADKYYADYLKTQGKNTLTKATAFFVNKWNTIAGVYGDKSKVGVKFAIQLKSVEVWWSNPSFYSAVVAEKSLNKNLNAFCANTKSNKADHRMLYTVGVGGGTMGLAWIGGICNPSRACSIVKSKTLTNVRVELHEFGHSIGFKHEPQMQPCSKPDGFMGWTVTHKFNDCYKRSLLETYKQSSRNCLRKVNVNKKVLNG